MNVRNDFPILAKKVNGKPITYFDNSCVTLKPTQVISAMDAYYTDFTACAGRSNHRFAEETTRRFEAAHHTLEKFINARENEVVLTRNTTEAINIVSNGLSFPKGSNVVTTNMEHNSNLVPWLRLAKKGVEHRMVPIGQNGILDMAALSKAVDRKTRLVSLVHTSNVTGTTIDARAAAKIAHDNGALLLMDGAQSAPHRPVDVRRDDIDFFAFSGHKMLGPSGTGALYGKKQLLEQLDQFIVGGDTVKDVTATGWVPEEVPMRFEAGLQDYAGAMGFAAAADYLMRIGMDKVRKEEEMLGKKLLDGVLSLDKVSILGPSDTSKRGALVSFNIAGIAPHDIALLLSESENIFVRSGMHCAHLYHKSLGLDKGSVRPSLYIYNTPEEIDRFITAMKDIITHFS